MPKLTPGLLKLLLNIYGPYLGAGVKVEYISKDWCETRVSMKLRWYNRNAVGTHFGGSLYSMVDPHLMLMLMQVLGKDYVVWDKAAEIEFVSPGRGTVYSTLLLDEQSLTEIQHQTANGKPCYPEFAVNILSENGDVVAKVRKVLYIRKKKEGANPG